MSARAKPKRRRVLVVTGSRAEFGLLRPVMAAIKKHKRLELCIAIAGEHLLGPANTWKEVAREFRIDAKIPMQRPRDRGRLDHAAACARGMAGFAAAYKRIKPDWVVVLGDRIEAFAAASAASIAGIAVCHIHGGDRAEGIADEAMRHAITKLAHLHCAATKLSAERIRKLGEPEAFIHVTGSPAIDGLAGLKPMSDRDYAALGRPGGVVLLHPWGASADAVHQVVETICIGSMIMFGSTDDPSMLAIDGRSLWLMPNHDPGREHIIHALQATELALPLVIREHLARSKFIALLKRISATPDGVFIGNSSAGLVEASALGVSVVNIGERQAGRERGGNVIDVPLLPDKKRFREALLGAIERAQAAHPARSVLFGNGRAGPRVAALLAKIDPHDDALLRKRNAY